MADDAGEPLSLEGKMVAILPSGNHSEVATNLRGAGGQVTELTRPDDLIVPTDQAGLVGAVRTAAAAFGDELRVFEAMRSALQGDYVVLVIEDAGPEAAAQLTEAGAETVWDFTEWTFKKVGGPEPEGPEGPS